MSSTLVTRPMSLTVLVVLATATLFVAASQAQQLLDSITSTLSIAFWEFVVAPLLVLAFAPIFLVLFTLTAIVVLPVLALVAALVLIAANSLIFHSFLSVVAGYSSSLVKNVARLRSQLASIRTSTHASKVEPHPALETEPAPINDTLVTHIPQPSVEPRQFKKRRPINYSGTRPPLPIDPLNDAHTRLTAHIARIRSKAWKTEALKSFSVLVQESALTPVATIATRSTQDDQINISTSPTSLTPVETDLPTAKVNLDLEALIENREQEPESTVTPIPPLSLSETTSIIEAGIETTELEHPSSPTEPVAEVEPSTLSTVSVPNIQADPYAHPAEFLVPDSPPLPTNEPNSTPSPHPNAEPIVHNVTDSTVDQNTAETVDSIITEHTGELAVNDAEVSARQQRASNLWLNLRLMGPEQQSDIPLSTPTPTPQADATNPPELLSTGATPSPAGTGPDVARSDLLTLVHDFPTQPFLDAIIPDDVLQAELELLATPAYQDTLAKMGLSLDGLVDALPTLGMSAPPTIDRGSQFAYIHNVFGPATSTSDIGSTFISNPTDHDGMPGLDATQVDTDMLLPSDAELLELAAAALATDGVHWAHDFMPLVAPGPQNEHLLAPLTDQELLELDHFLQLTAASLAPVAPQTPNGTPPAADIFNPEPALLPTDQELLALAGAAIAEGTAGMVLDDYAVMDFNLNLADTDMLFLDPSQLEQLDQATQSVIADLTNEALELSGMTNPNDLSAFDLADPSTSDHHFDPSELARMWGELGASLEDWVGQVPGAMDFSEEDMMRMLMEFDALDATCSPSPSPIVKRGRYDANAHGV
ncbi:hypothetical protein RSAG8_11637, partial [Rhizoctonia solani AG-8 WAC10335]